MLGNASLASHAAGRPLLPGVCVHRQAVQCKMWSLRLAFHSGVTACAGTNVLVKTSSTLCPTLQALLKVAAIAMERSEYIKSCMTAAASFTQQLQPNRVSAVLEAARRFHAAQVSLCNTALYHLIGLLVAILFTSSFSAHRVPPFPSKQAIASLALSNIAYDGLGLLKNCETRLRD